jgi:hypothetical protein
MGTLRVALVGCSKRKATEPRSAADLYQSPLFRKSLAYAQKTCDRVYILSAKHGLLATDTVVEPYDLALTELSRAERGRWDDRVAEEIRRAIPAGDTLVILAGEAYAGFAAMVPHTIEWPLAGLEVGERLEWLTAWAKGGAR